MILRKTVFTLIVISLLLIIAIPEVKSSPDSSYLYVNSYNELIVDWVKVGSPPYLSTQNEPTDYGYSSAKNEVWSEFSFADLGGSPIINSVNISVYSDCGSEKIRVWIWDSGISSWVNVGDLSGSGWSWRTLDISGTLTTYSEVNNAKIYFESRAIGGWGGSVSVDCARLGVDYSVPPTYYYAIYYFETNSTFLTDGIKRANGSEIQYLNDSVIELQGVINKSWTFDSFNITTGSESMIEVNPYNYTINANSTIWLYISNVSCPVCPDPEPDPEPEPREFILADAVFIINIFILCLAFIGIKIPLAGIIAVCLAIMLLIPMPSDDIWLITFTVATLLTSIIILIANIVRRW